MATRVAKIPRGGIKSPAKAHRRLSLGRLLRTPAGPWDLDRRRSVAN